MKRFGWLSTPLALAFALVATVPLSAFAEEPPPKALGKGPAYETLSRLPVLHEGRIKPLDTLAREEVKQIFGRETVKLQDASEKNRVIETWGAVAALFDWSVRPDFWDEQPIILVEYVPLKRLILADEIRTRLAAVAGKPSTSAADKAAIDKLAIEPEISNATIEEFLAKSSLAGDDKKSIATLAAELSEEHKWLTPHQLEEAQILDAGQKLPFNAWFGEVVKKKRQADQSPNGEVKLNEVEKRAYEVGTRLVHYNAIRDREMRSVEPLLVMPRPSNKTYLGFLAQAFEKARKARDTSTLTPLELDGAKALDTYWNELPIDDRAVPGTDPEFDKQFVSWLRDSSAWIPLKALLDAKPEELTSAGFALDRVQAFQTAFKQLDSAEYAAPGEIDPSKAAALVAAARGVGDSVESTLYPTPKAIDRETFFNKYNPFFMAPMAYLLAVILLSVTLGFQGFERKSWLGRFGLATHVLGVLGLIAGIGLEAAGFYLRVMISGWAPVTNMYETVIWVSAVSAVLGLILELIYRKAYAALAGSGVALLGTVLAANVPLLDPDIKTLQPVLRSNYWLTIHVLTEVSSYGAFLMGAGLGLIATFYYLVATYRRSPNFTELLLPIVPGLPLLAMGGVGLAAAYGQFGPTWETGNLLMMVFVSMACIGGALTISVPVALGGEVVSRLSFHDEAELDAAAIVGESQHAPAATSVQTVTIGESQGAGAVATLSKPTVAEIRAMAATNRPKLDARGRAMQATAAKIKPISNFIYRSMQVGVLLISAGTILGGIWADYSWGRFWGWDPKEVWALITLLVYLIPLHGRFAGWFNTFALVASSVVCSLSVIMAWYGVNFVLGVGLHSYGFVEGGGQGVVLAVLTAVLALPIAAGWRRHLGSRALLVA